MRCKANEAFEACFIVMQPWHGRGDFDEMCERGLGRLDYTHRLIMNGVAVMRAGMQESPLKVRKGPVPWDGNRAGRACQILCPNISSFYISQ